MCVELCPSRSLSIGLLESGGPSDSSEISDGSNVVRFELDPGRCIGCGVCAEACPEAAIEMALPSWRVAVAGAGRSCRVDLLAARG